MENIVEPNQSFDFSKLSLAHPSGIQGGAYFTRIEYNKKPLYIQTEKSLTRQGIVKSGKKFHCDLMFDKNSESLIHWFEKLEEKCQKLIYDKKDSWFQTPLEESDIETAFNSLIRIYKSGKYYLVRTNIKNNQANQAVIKIYNEKQIPLNVEDIKAETEIISILEIQGIKFTSRNFQIEIELKQIMVLDNEPMFDTCLIKSFKNTNMVDSSMHVDTKEPLEEIPIINDNELNKINKLNKLNEINIFKKDDFSLLKGEELEIDTEEIDKKIENYSFDSLENIDIIEDKDSIIEINNDNHDNIDNINNNDNNDNDNHNDVSIDFEIEDLNNNNDPIQENIEEIKEIEMDLENLEPIKLKKPNEVYFDLYKEARNKAKLAKKNAILAYLEVKNIKKTFMLDNLIDSDSDFDNEVDEISESELEGL
jgi:hypothetical protein